MSPRRPCRRSGRRWPARSGRTCASSAAASPDCSTALHLAERGYRVVLLEQHGVGWGASGRSGAQALFGVAAPQEKLERLIGAADARRIWDMTLEGIDLVRERIARHGIDCDWVAGQMHVANKPRHVEELKAWQEELQGRYGYTSARLLDRAEVAGLLATERLSRRHVRPARRPPASAALHPGAGGRRRGRGRAGSTRTRACRATSAAPTPTAPRACACAPRAAKCCASTWPLPAMPG